MQRSFQNVGGLFVKRAPTGVTDVNTVAMKASKDHDARTDIGLSASHLISSPVEVGPAGSPRRPGRAAVTAGTLVGTTAGTTGEGWAAGACRPRPGRADRSAARPGQNGQLASPPLSSSGISRNDASEKPPNSWRSPEPVGIAARR